MATDYIPHSYAHLSDWLANLAEKLPLHSATLGLTAAELNTLLAEIAALSAPLETLLARQIELDSATGALQQSLRDHLPKVRATLRHLKTSPGYTAGIGEDLQVIGGGEEFDAGSYKPLLTAEAFAGYVRLKVRKSGAEAINLYVRVAGGAPKSEGPAEWRLLVARRTRFPFDDDSPLAASGTAETREYRAIGVVADKEVGHPSDIVSVTYGG